MVCIRPSPSGTFSSIGADADVVVDLRKWIKVSKSGILRPEMLPTTLLEGLRVYGFSLDLERVMTILYKVRSIRCVRMR